MRAVKGLLVLAMIILLTGLLHARDTKTDRIILVDDNKDNTYPALTSDRPGENVSAFVDTYCLVRYDFDPQDWQGWTRVDNTAQIDTFFHVDDFIGLAGGDFGRLAPIEGLRSWWCGAGHDPYDPYLCGWASPPGYGNLWHQHLESDTVYFTGTITFSYHIVFDTEDDFDTVYVEYDKGEGDFGLLAAYAGIGDSTATHEIDLPGGMTSLRFRFVSDIGYSDEDGEINTDGAAVIDSIRISDLGGEIDFEDCESASTGAMETDGDDNGFKWRARVPEPYGMYSGLEYHLRDLDPCNDNMTYQIVFFSGSSFASIIYPGLFETPYCLGGGGLSSPCHDEMVISPVIDLGMYSSLCDEEQDTHIPPTDMSQLTKTELRFSAYQDLPLDNLVFYFTTVRNIRGNGCPLEWKPRMLGYNPNPDPEYRFNTRDISEYVEYDEIQVAVGCVDMCSEWYLVHGTCAGHTPAPWIDNVGVYRYKTLGPLWKYRWSELFQDNFPSDELFIESYVRADMAMDTGGPGVIVPGDCIEIECSSPFGGGIAESPSGGPEIYMHVRCTYIGSPLSPWGPKPPQITGPSLEGSCGSFVTTLGDWTVIQASHYYKDAYRFDLNDELLTRGYLVEYYFSAKDNYGETTYLPTDAPSLIDRVFVEDSNSGHLFEFTCLPTMNSDILYVDDYHGEGIFWGSVEPYINHSFAAVIASGDHPPDRYDVNDPSMAIASGPGSRAYQSQLTLAYDLIIWDSGDLRKVTIADGAVVGTDKSPDEQLLLDWLNLSDHTVNLWIMGDNVAEDLTGLPSLGLLTACGVTLTAPSYYLLGGGAAGGTVSPLILTATAGILDGLNWWLYGGCPVINSFDVIDKTGVGVVEATYPPAGSIPTPGAVVKSSWSNPFGHIARTVWFGFSFMSIRDGCSNVPIVRNSIMESVFNYFQHGLNVDITDAEVPCANSLMQNFPNPFNPATEIRFSLKSKGSVTIEIYDVGGRLVRTLVDDVMDAGSHSVKWNGKNNSGASTASGVYFCQMKTNGFVKRNKVVLLR